MDGKGRALDNIYIERFWGSLKREKIYLNPPNGGVDLYKQIKEYVSFYNSERRHKSLGRITFISKIITMVKILFLLMKCRTNGKGFCPIRCRITFNDNRKEFSTILLFNNAIKNITHFFLNC